MTRLLYNRERKEYYVCRTRRRRKQLRRRPFITIRGTQDPLMNEQYSDQVEKHHHRRHPHLAERIKSPNDGKREIEESIEFLDRAVLQSSLQRFFTSKRT